MTEFKIEPREHKIRVYLSVLLIFVVCAFGLAVCLMQYPKAFQKGKDFLVYYLIEYKDKFIFQTNLKIFHIYKTSFETYLHNIVISSTIVLHLQIVCMRCA